MGQNILSAQNVHELEFEKREFFYKLYLPYQRTEGSSRVFTDDTTLAINIKEMTLDGNQIFPQSDSILRDFVAKIKIRHIRKTESTLYITMTWIPANSDDARRIAWNNLRSSCSYIIPEGSKTMLIRYNIILPFSGVSVEKILHNQIPENAYTEDYLIKVDLKNIF